MNTPVKYVKSFCKGQITIPKEIRDSFGIGDEFWLRLSINEGRIIAEPVERETNRQDFKNKLLKIKGNWFVPAEYSNNRKQVEKQIRERTS